MKQLQFWLVLTCTALSAHMLWAQSLYPQPYTFTTLAGKAGVSGSADGPASTATFSGPSGLAVDKMGVTYIADAVNHTIRTISPNAAVTTVAGLAGYSGSTDSYGGGARFNRPMGVAADGYQRLYVADCDNHTIRVVAPKLTAPGIIVTTLAGAAGAPGSADGTGSGARFSSPRGVAVDFPGRTIYVADKGNHTLRKVTSAGVVTTLAGLAGAPGSADGTGTAAQFSSPCGVALDSAGNVYVADTGNHIIRKVTADAVVTTLAGLAGAAGSTDGAGSSARFQYPTGIAVDSAGNLYVTEANGNHTVRKVTPEGVTTTLAGLAGATGSADGTGSNARFHNPEGIGVDAAGKLYVADFNNATIRLGRLAPAPPVLSASRSDNQLVISWPLTASNFVLEARSPLSSAVGWAAVNDAASTNGDHFVLTNGLDGSARFFRLRLP